MSPWSNLKLCRRIELTTWSKAKPDGRATHRPLSLDDVSELVEGPLIDIGSHTVTRSVLFSLPLISQREEIQRSKHYLEELVDRPITSFAYPYGSQQDYTTDTMRLACEAGFSSACSTLATPVRPDSDLLQLPRLQVHDWDGDQFAAHLSMWLHD